MSNTIVNKVAAVFAIATLTLSLLFALPARAQTVAELQAQIQSLLATIAALQSQLAAMQGGAGAGSMPSNSNNPLCGFTFTQNHKLGDVGGQVKQIQMFLNMDPATQVATTGAGSPGNETSYFGAKTQAAVKKFQAKYASEVLAPVGLSAPTGYWGPSSRAKANALLQAMCAQPAPQPTPQPTTTQSGDITVSAATQPANAVIPQGASRVPFTRFTLSGNGTVDQVTVKLQGLINKNSFKSVKIVDDAGNVVTEAKTFDSNKKATFNRDITVNGSRTLTVVADMSSSLGSGDQASIAVVDIKVKNGTLAGTLPIVGATHTMNGNVSVGSLDVNHQTVADVKVGDTNKKIASVKLTANGEQIKVKSLILDQEGKADLTKALANAKAKVGSDEYSVSVTDNDITVDFGSGVTLDNGDDITVDVYADIVGEADSTNSNDDIKLKAKDVNATGLDYGYNVGLGTVDAAQGLDITGTIVTFEKDSTFDSPVKVNPGDNNVVMSRLLVTNTSSEDAVARTFKVEVKIDNQSSSNVSDTDADLKDFSLVVAGSDQGSQTVDLPAVNAGNNATTSVTFTDVTIPSGKDVKVEFKGDIDSSLPNGVKYEVVSIDIDNAELVGGDNISTNADSGFNIGHETQVTTGTFTFTQDTNLAENKNKAVKAGTTGVVLGEWKMKAKDADVTLNALDVELTSTGANPDAIVSGDLKLVVDGNEVASEAVPSGASPKTVSFSSVGITVAKGETKKLQVVADIKSSTPDGATIRVSQFNNFAYDTTPGSAPTMPITVSQPTVTVLQAIPVIAKVNEGTLTLSQSFVANQTLPVKFSVKADGADVKVATTTFDISTSNVTVSNAELVVFDSSNNEVLRKAFDTTTAGKLIATSTSSSAPLVTVPDGETYTFTIEADVAASAGGYATVEFKDANDSIKFWAPTGVAGASFDESLLIPEDITATINTNL